MSSARREHDLLGERELPGHALYGIHTLRSVENFPLTGARMHPAWVGAMAVVKAAAARAHADAHELEAAIAQAIQTAAQELRAGEHREQILVDPLQGGAGTSFNMNVNEVLANRAAQLLGGQPGDHHLVHPNDHVNLAQSTNDVVPTALRIAAIELLGQVADAMAELQAGLQAKEAEFAGVLKVGRTELMDAVPMTVGQEFSAWAQAIARDRWRLYKVEERLRQVPLGGTAIGTGINASRRYIYGVIERLRELTGMGLARAENLIDATQNADVFVEVSGLLKAAAVNLAKLSQDLRLLASGPHAGLGELRLPARQAGSSIMPGKVNPVIPEAAQQVAYQVMACDLAITLGAQAGQLELNAFVPLIGHNLLMQLDLLRQGARMLLEHCVRGLEVDAARCTALLEGSHATVTALAPRLGYEVASAIAREALAGGVTVRELVRRQGLLSESELEHLLSAAELTRPGSPGPRRTGS